MKKGYEAQQKQGLHRPVLLKEATGYIRPAGDGIYVDATAGGGGYTEKILEISAPGSTVIGIDSDPSMLETARRRLNRFGKRCILVNGSYSGLASILKELNISRINGVVFDLGASTEHFIDPGRGFSFRSDGPLDMRFDRSKGPTAEEIVNTYPEYALIEILRRYGEERRAVYIAERITKERKKKRITSTKRLADIAAGAYKKRGRRIHPATKTFQALRIAVNGELDKLKAALPQAVSMLSPGGRICVVSYHSLEDRIVKRFFRACAGKCICPPEELECTCSIQPKIRIITKKPITPQRKEIVSNKRARSAKLRAAEKI